MRRATVSASTARPRLAVRLTLPFVSILLLSSLSFAQNWAGILSQSRATDWSGVGVQGGIPDRTSRCGSVISAYSGSATTINNAIANCGTGQYVELGAGTFTLSSGIVFSKSNVTLRGQGAASTKLIINGASTGCSLFYSAAILMCAGTGNIATTSGGGPGPDHSANWTAGFSGGTTVITLSSTSGLAVGSTLWLDQADDQSDSGDVYVCSGTSNCSNQGGNSFARPGRAQTEPHLVTAISGNNVTIEPGVRAPNFSSAKSAGAWWGNSGTIQKSAGVEDLSVDFTGAGGPGIEMVNNTNSWVKGVRLIRTGGPGSFVFNVLIVNGFHLEIRDNYFYGPEVQGNTQYAIAPHEAGSNLYENNIFHGVVSAMIPNDPEAGSVYAYNYVNSLRYSGPVQLHSAGDMMNLYEGNNMPNFIGDVIHGTHHFDTLFRNQLDGYAESASQVNENSGVSLLTRSRFFNVIGNVIGDSHFTTYESNMAGSANAIFELGWQGSGSGTAVSNDSNVKRTTMRWGNWDSVNNAVRFVASEVPSGITNYANPVPATQTLPASFFHPGQPGWWSTPWGTPKWPAVGPDVSGGNVSNAPTGGHADKIPARLCFEHASADSSYGGTVKAFDAQSCYSATALTGAPSAPTSVAAVVR